VRKIARFLREFCGTWSCFVVLSRDKCNGCHASPRFLTQQNQLSKFLILPAILTPSNYEPGGREFESLRARQFFPHTARARRSCAEPQLSEAKWLRELCEYLVFCQVLASASKPVCVFALFAVPNLSDFEPQRARLSFARSSHLNSQALTSTTSFGLKSLLALAASIRADCRQLASLRLRNPSTRGYGRESRASPAAAGAWTKGSSDPQAPRESD
jgi:hypothetical protein